MKSIQLEDLVFVQGDDSNYFSSQVVEIQTTSSSTVLYTCRILSFFHNSIYDDDNPKWTVEENKILPLNLIKNTDEISYFDHSFIRNKATFTTTRSSIDSKLVCTVVVKYKHQDIKISTHIKNIFISKSQAEIILKRNGLQEKHVSN